MRLLLIADTFPPLRSSGAVQLRDLAIEFIRQGHELCVLLPDSGLEESWSLQVFEGAKVLRLRAPRTKEIGFVRRTLAELIMPYAMLRNLRKSPVSVTGWEGVIWYSPSIFHGPLVEAVKKSSKCRGYLIIRDIFPEWTVDLGLLRRGLPYRFFSSVARYQYSVADVIGVQSPGNQRYFHEWVAKPGRKLEVLPNWLGQSRESPCSIRVDETALVGRRIFLYAGNMGVAQGMDIILNLANALRQRSDLGFLFVGRGSEVARLRKFAESQLLDNVAFFDEVDPDEIPGLCDQCVAGIVSLDSRHRSQNIPGKFLVYMQSGLPVLASVSLDSDLSSLIRDERVGQVCETNNLSDLLEATERLLLQIDAESDLRTRCRSFFDRSFSVSHTVKKIVSALSMH